MTGKDCTDIDIEWWTTPREELQRANQSYADDIVAHHQALHPDKDCPRHDAAAEWLASNDKQMSA